MPGKTSSIAFQSERVNAIRPREPANEGAVADSQFRRDRQTAGLEVDQQFAPALCAFPHADLKTQQLLLALRCRSEHDQHTLGHGLHTGLQVDAVRPDIHVATGRKIAALPAIVVLLPARREPRDGAR